MIGAFTVPPSASEITRGLLACPATPKARVWCVPVRRAPNLRVGTHTLTLTPFLQRFPVLEYEWTGEGWNYRGWRAG